jgi:large subunit ribosomal protein L28e
MSDALIWNIVRNNNCFLRKQGSTKRVGAVQFSAEPGNVMSVSSFKYSGIANTNTVDVSAVVTGAAGAKRDKIAITTRTSSRNPKKSSTSTGVACCKIVKGKFVTPVTAACKATAGSRYYRADLTSAVAAKYQRLSTGTRAKKGAIKKSRNAAKTGRK